MYIYYNSSKHVTYQMLKNGQMDTIFSLYTVKK